jgi:ribosomal protein S18 acetylase RimI-like enzyme
MAAITQISNPPQRAKIRRLNPRRDLGYVADLIELCFAETLDIDGKRYLSRMRQTAQMPRNRWFSIDAFQINITAEGFVWEENGQIIGNISLIPFATFGRPIYLIANVAVHPDFRRQGIARSLTQAAMEWCQKRHVSSMWLQVRDTNLAAVKLYESVGFIEQARRTTWSIQSTNVQGEAPSGMRIVSPKSRHWPLQKKWLQQNYPDELFWYWPIRRSAFRSGIWGTLVNLFTDIHIRHWGVEQQGQLMGLLSWKATTSYADQLWLAAPPETEDIVLQTILPYMRWRERNRRPLSIDLPVGRAVSTLHEAGFRPDNTLIWMEKS